MATITTDTFLDAAARTAGETWTINGAALTIRTDTRVHAGAPAALTGSLGTMTISTGLGGSIVIDATKVRWLSFTGGTGNVPAIGTIVSQGGVSGYLLGVWPVDLSSAPTAVGAAMPSNGFIKFREVTGGAFVQSATLLTGIGAMATQPDRVGWIEVCVDSASTFLTSELGAGLVVKGDWFSLGTTSGVRGQTFTVPTNGGGAGTHVFGVQIETAPGSDVYEWYPTAAATGGAALWAPANFATDLRAKFVETMGNGVIRVGTNGTVDVGHVPPAGCKVRIQNVLGRTVAAASRAVNQVPGAVTRAGMSGSSLAGGNYTIDGMHCDFTIAGNSISNGSFKNFTFETTYSFTNNRNPILFDNVCGGGFTSPAANIIAMTEVSEVTMQNVKLVNSGTISGGLRFAQSNAVSMTNVESINAKSRTATIYQISVNDSFNITATNVKTKGGLGVILTASKNVTIRNLDFIDRLEGPTTTIAPINAIQFASSSDNMVDGFTVGENGALANTHPYSSIFSDNGQNSNNRIRNVGTRLNPVSLGTANNTGTVFSFSSAAGGSSNKFQRIYTTAPRTNIGGLTATNYNPNYLFEDIFLGYGNGATENGRNPIYRKIGSALPPGTPTANAGLHWSDHFLSDTTGAIKWYANTPSATTADRNYLEVTPAQGTGYINSSSTISLDTLNDAAYSEVNWEFLGHTGFANTNPVIVGNAVGLVVSYQLDTGTGFSGVWKTATGANLSAETVSPAGFKMKIRIQQTGSTTVTAINSITFSTTTSVEAQANNQFPLDVVTLTLEGLKPGSEVRAYVGTDPATAVQIGGTESSGETFSFTHTSSGQVGYIHIFAMGYQPIMIPRTFAYQDSSLLIQQVIDRNYIN